MAVDWNSPAVIARMQAATMRGVTTAIHIVEDHAVNLIMQGPKSGKVYARRGVQHQASAPGEAPANDTGRLVNSRTVDLFPAEIRARLTFRTAYALPLEVGTAKMEPRPYARRSLAERRGDIIASIAGEIKRELG